MAILHHKRAMIATNAGAEFSTDDQYVALLYYGPCVMYVLHCTRQ
jgi:hypothetical protein